MTDATPTPTPEPTPTPTPAPTDWKASLPEEVRKSVMKYSTVEDLAKGLKDTAQKLTEHTQKYTLARPKDDAAPEEWATFYNALGRPESADKYEIGLADDVAKSIPDTLFADLRQRAHALGLTAKQATQYVQDALDLRKSAVAETQVDVRKAREETEAALRKEWGANYEYNVQTAQRVLERFGNDADREALARFGNDPAVTRFLHKLGGQFREDTLLVSGTPAGQASNTQAERMKLLGSEAYQNPRHPDHANTVAKVKEMYRTAFAA